MGGRDAGTFRRLDAKVRHLTGCRFFTDDWDAFAKVLPAGPKTLDECKGKCINDYQQDLVQRWVDDLKGEFNVKVNQDVFERVKASLKK